MTASALRNMRWSKSAASINSSAFSVDGDDVLDLPSSALLLVVLLLLIILLEVEVEVEVEVEEEDD
jgi:hypothetical protein